ncbi:MAG: acyl-CoA reductase [Ekhidna sp.]|nr:acyl-CoA reductase [Ekhidna sp.]MBC6410619.1 acyl-CoA reductase [Ekhidna sp.]MBC6425124.1 acyl-CoA reductase [Ekhidna sp.]
MKKKERIEAFVKLGKRISNLSEEEIESLSHAAKAKNGWFTYESIKKALNGIAFMLEKEKLKKWVTNYDLTGVPKVVGVVMAGNIPLAGFHDLLSVLISGHFAVVKLSSNDEFLTSKIIEWLIETEPGIKKNIEVREKLTQIDAAIATGSDNTARYFEYYFKKIPHIIRRNRTSVAILTGEENGEELKNLGEEVFSYFGLGCRNVSKIFTPKDFDLKEVFRYFEDYEAVIHHHKYRNNYDYHKSIFLVNKTPHLDTGFLLIRSTDDLVAPVSVLYHQEYDTIENLEKAILKSKENKIQCIVGRNYTPFGTAQRPELWDYADSVDTLKFLNDFAN